MRLRTSRASNQTHSEATRLPPVSALEVSISKIPNKVKTQLSKAYRETHMWEWSFSRRLKSLICHRKTVTKEIKKANKPLTFPKSLKCLTHKEVWTVKHILNAKMRTILTTRSWLTVFNFYRQKTTNQFKMNRRTMKRVALTVKKSTLSSVRKRTHSTASRHKASVSTTVPRAQRIRTVQNTIHLVLKDRAVLKTRRTFRPRVKNQQLHWLRRLKWFRTM